MPEKEEELLITSFLSDNDAHLSVNKIIIVKGRGHQGVPKKPNIWKGKQERQSGGMSPKLFEQMAFTFLLTP